MLNRKKATVDDAVSQLTDILVRLRDVQSEQNALHEELAEQANAAAAEAYRAESISNKIAELLS